MQAPKEFDNLIISGSGALLSDRGIGSLGGGDVRRGGGSVGSKVGRLLLGEWRVRWLRVIWNKLEYEAR